MTKEELTEVKLVMREQRRISHANVMSDGLKIIVPAVTVIVCVYLITSMIESFAGVESIADVKVIADVGLGTWLAYLAAALGAGWGAKERLLRKKLAEDLGGRIAELETEIDPGRTSSGLLPSGDHRRRD